MKKRMLNIDSRFYNRTGISLTTKAIVPSYCAALDTNEPLTVPAKTAIAINRTVFPATLFDLLPLDWSRG